MLDIAPPRFRVEEEEGRRGIFVAEPLPRGLGHTLGNSLRRVMLSGLMGAAVTKIRIEGVSHEFSTIPGVKEDVVDIILNIKGLKFRLEREEPIELSITKDGPGEVTAANIELKADVEIVDPETYIASVSEGGNLDMRLTVERGQGYARAEQNKSDADPIGVIAVDSLFSPVQRVNYSVRETRAGARADLDSLRLEVFTDGRIEPQEALQAASRQLMDFLGLFTDGYQGAAGAADGRPRGGRAVITDERPVEDLELTVRSYNCLKREGVDTVGQLATMTEEELMNIRNLGMKSVDEIRSKLLEYGYSLESEGGDEAR
ncbi:MAG: DNA-directed RNA polymerase subunit alpha [Actinomycetota bacterium]|nr:DNA-directed RNA polymerase subunit alpha [Actinomycetota bacterium]